MFTYIIKINLLIILSISITYVFFLVSFAYQIIRHSLLTEEFFEISILLVILIILK